MKDTHIQIRIEQCLALAKASHCPRRKLAAMLIDPTRNVVLADGYNGGPRGGEGTLCKGHYCERDGVTAEDLEIRESWRHVPQIGRCGTQSIRGVGVYSKVSQGVDLVTKDGLLQWFEKNDLVEKLAEDREKFPDAKTAQEKAEEWAAEFIAAHPPIQSGTKMERGCHHAEMNVVCNAAAGGVSCRGAWMIVLAEPCMMCSKLAHHAGIKRVICVKGGYLGGTEGVDYLREHGVQVTYVDGPKDPRFDAA